MSKDIFLQYPWGGLSSLEEMVAIEKRVHLITSLRQADKLSCVPDGLSNFIPRSSYLTELTIIAFEIAKMRLRRIQSRT